MTPNKGNISESMGNKWKVLKWNIHKYRSKNVLL